jgi:ankyrin repeat protein
MNKMTPFFKLIKNKDINSPEFKYCFDKMIEAKVDVNTPDQFGMSAFWHFYTKNQYQQAFFLADNGADLNHIDNYGMFALKKETMSQNKENLKALLDKKADANQRDEFGRTCLHHLCNMSHQRDVKELMRLLLTNGADIYAQDHKGRTPLHYLFVQKNMRSETGPYDPVENLRICITDQTAGGTLQDCNGKSVLHYMAQRSSLESFKLLIKTFQEFLALEDVTMNTCLGTAINFGHNEFAAHILKEKLVDMNGYIYEEKRAKRPGQVFGNPMGGFGQGGFG